MTFIISIFRNKSRRGIDPAVTKVFFVILKIPSTAGRSSLVLRTQLRWFKIPTHDKQLSCSISTKQKWLAYSKLNFVIGGDGGI